MVCSFTCLCQATLLHSPEVGQCHQCQHDEQHTEGGEVRVEHERASQTLEGVQREQPEGILTEIQTSIKVPATPEQSEGDEARDSKNINTQVEGGKGDSGRKTTQKQD